MNKPYHERPDWILKSIVYFCDNYTIDGKSLRKYKRGAIKEYRNPTVIWCTHRNESIIERIDWSEAPQGWDFWDCLWYLMVAARPNEQSIGCVAWTDYEKRKIDKMPRVK